MAELFGHVFYKFLTFDQNCRDEMNLPLIVVRNGTIYGATLKVILKA